MNGASCRNRIIQSDDEFLEIFFLGSVDVCSSLGLFGGQDFSSFTSTGLLDLSLQLL